MKKYSLSDKQRDQIQCIIEIPGELGLYARDIIAVGTEFDDERIDTACNRCANNVLN